MKRIGALLLFMLPTVAFGGKNKVVIKEGTIVEGEVQKPEIAVFISRQELNNTNEISLRESFIPKVVESTKKDPL